MWEKLTASFDAFRKGSAVADPAAWKKGQITANAVGLALSALCHAIETFTSYRFPFSASDFDTIGAAILVVVNGVLTVTTTEKIGILPPKAPVQSKPSPSDNEGPGASDTNGA